MNPIPQPKSSFAGRLQRARQRLDKTQQETAALLEVPHKTYVNWEQAMRTPPSWQQKLLLKALRSR